MAFLLGAATAGSDVVRGTALDDDFAGYNGNDTLIGGGGSDYFVEGLLVWQWTSTQSFTYGVTYDFGRGSDLIDGGSGLDAVFYSGTTQAAVLRLWAGTVTRGAEVDTLISIEGIVLGEGNDKAIAGRGGFIVDFGDGKDMLYGLASNSEYYGGAGVDTINMRNFTGGAVTIRLDQFQVTVAGLNSVWIEGFENIVGAKTVVNSIFGDTNNNVLSGGAYGDTLYGHSGADTIYGYDGNDIIDGQWGNDLVIGGNGADRITDVDGADTLRGGFGDDTINSGNGYDIIYGGGGADLISDLHDGATIYGDIGNDTIVASAGTVYGGAGDDEITYQGYQAIDIYAGDGNDLVKAGAGPGVANGGNGSDTIILTGGHVDIGGDTGRGASFFVYGFETIKASNQAILNFGIAVDGLTLDFRNTGARSSADVPTDSNVIYFTWKDDDVTSWGSGNEFRMANGTNHAWIYGENNSIYSGNDNDSFYIGAASGRVSTGAGDDRVDLGYSGGPSTLVAFLGAGNDVINISQGFGSVYLGDGDDLAAFDIYAPSGGTMWGGAGADTFIFHSIAIGAATIADFNPLEDRLTVELTTGLSDVTSISQIGADAVLFYYDPNGSSPADGFYLTLSNVLVSDLSDAIFL